MGINNLDLPQQKTSYQQALEYNDRCPVQPANLSLGSRRFFFFKALIITGAAMEKLMKSPHVTSVSSPWQRRASLHVAWDPLVKREKTGHAMSHLPGPLLLPSRFICQRGPVTATHKHSLH